MSLEDVELMVRSAIRASPLSVSALCRRADVGRTNVQRFMNGRTKYTISLKTLVELCRVLGLRITLESCS